MSIPKVVQQQEAEANERIEALEQQENAGQSSFEAERQAEITNAPGPEPESGDEIRVEEQDETLKSKIAELEQEKEKIEHTRQVFEGRLNKRNKELEEKLDEQQKVVEDLQAKLEQAEKQGDLGDIFTEEEKEILGPDYIDMAAKVAQEVTKRVESKVSQLEQNMVQNTTSNFWKTVMRNLNLSDPELTQVENSRKFKTFMAKDDGLSGFTIGDSLDRAIQSKDADQAIRIYQNFLDSLGTDGRQQSAPSPERVSGAVDHGAVIETDSFAKLADDFAKGRIDYAKFKQREAVLDGQMS